MSNLYDTDFHEWAETQAAAQRSRSANALEGAGYRSHQDRAAAGQPAPPPVRGGV